MSAHIEVPPFDRVIGNMVHRRPAVWRRLGSIESSYLGPQLHSIAIEKPIFIAGLARAGSTMLLELLNAFPETASHRYRDFPLVFTPFWWNRVVDLSPGRKTQTTERAHKDRIEVTAESPEAMEEPLWSAFFPHLHKPGQSHVLRADSRNEEFDAFYRDHIRKVLLVRGGTRYLAKSNYSVTRLEYLLSLFPDARIVIPIRAPLDHVTSLAKQHALFCEASRENPAVREHLRNVGHFEFGPDRHAINTGDGERVREIEQHWANGDEAVGLAKYWRLVYDFVWQQLAENHALREASMVVRYEDLCTSPRTVIEQLAEHCALTPAPEVVATFSSRFSLPTYYRPTWSAEERRAVEAITAETAGRFGY